MLHVLAKEYGRTPSDYMDAPASRLIFDSKVLSIFNEFEKDAKAKSGNLPNGAKRFF